MRRSFGTVAVRKPKASRASSSEVYLLARNPVRNEDLAREPLDLQLPRCDSPGLMGLESLPKGIERGSFEE